MDIRTQREERMEDAGDLYRASGNVLLDRLLGATLHSFPAGEDEAAADAGLQDSARTLSKSGRMPYVIHLGVNHPRVAGPATSSQAAR